MVQSTNMTSLQAAWVSSEVNTLSKDQKIQVFKNLNQENRALFLSAQKPIAFWDRFVNADNFTAEKAQNMHDKLGSIVCIIRNVKAGKALEKQTDDSFFSRMISAVKGVMNLFGRIGVKDYTKILDKAQGADFGKAVNSYRAELATLRDKEAALEGSSDKKDRAELKLVQRRINILENDLNTFGKEIDSVAENDNVFSMPEDRVVSTVKNILMSEIRRPNDEIQMDEFDFDLDERVALKENNTFIPNKHARKKEEVEVEVEELIERPLSLEENGQIMGIYDAFLDKIYAYAKDFPEEARWGLVANFGAASERKEFVDSLSFMTADERSEAILKKEMEISRRMSEIDDMQRPVRDLSESQKQEINAMYGELKAALEEFLSIERELTAGTFENEYALIQRDKEKFENGLSTLSDVKRDEMIALNRVEVESSISGYKRLAKTTKELLEKQRLEKYNSTLDTSELDASLSKAGSLRKSSWLENQEGLEEIKSKRKMGA